MDKNLLKIIIENAKKCLIKPNEVSHHVIEEIIFKYNNIAAEVNDKNKLPKIKSFSIDNDFNSDKHLSDCGVKKITLIYLNAEIYLNTINPESSTKKIIKPIFEFAKKLYEEGNQANAGALDALIELYNSHANNLKGLSTVHPFDPKKDVIKSNSHISEEGLRKIRKIKNNLETYINNYFSDESNRME